MVQIRRKQATKDATSSLMSKSIVILVAPLVLFAIVMLDNRLATRKEAGGDLLGNDKVYRFKNVDVLFYEGEQYDDEGNDDDDYYEYDDKYYFGAEVPSAGDDHDDYYEDDEYLEETTESDGNTKFDVDDDYYEYDDQHLEEEEGGDDDQYLEEVK